MIAMIPLSYLLCCHIYSKVQSPNPGPSPAVPCRCRLVGPAASSAPPARGDAGNAHGDSGDGASCSSGSSCYGSPRFQRCDDVDQGISLWYCKG